MVKHPSSRRLEVVDTKEQSDSARVLSTDRIGLPLAVCLGEQQPGLSARRSDDNPTLGTSIVRD